MSAPHPAPHTVRPSASTPRLSASQLRLFAECPRRYAFRYVERMTPAFVPSAMLFGKAIHVALAAFHEALSAGEVLSLDALTARLFDALRAPQEAPVQFGPTESVPQLLALGEAMLRPYTSDPPIPLLSHVELPFEIPYRVDEAREVTLTGRIDFVVGPGRLGEWKTAKTRPRPARETHGLQLAIYGLAARALYGTLPRIEVITLLNLPAGEITRETVEVDDELVGRFTRTVHALLRALERSDFPRKPSPRCSNCEYEGPCWTRTTMRFGGDHARR